MFPAIKHMISSTLEWLELYIHTTLCAAYIVVVDGDVLFWREKRGRKQRVLEQTKKNFGKIDEVP